MSSSWWKIRRTDANAYRLDLELASFTRSRRILLLSDIHWDNSYCRLDLLKRCLDSAKAECSPVIVAGDFFCAMQGQWDKRKSKEALRPEHRDGVSYLDALVDTAAEWLEPYAANMAILAQGNHETSIKRHHEVDLLQRLSQELRRMGSPVECAPYWGFVVLAAKFIGKQTDSKSLLWHHGWGGGGEASRGVTQWQQLRTQYAADVYLTGHIHRRVSDENVQTSVTARGLIAQSNQIFLRASCWKDESRCGWGNERGMASRPIGGWWLEIDRIKRSSGYAMELKAAAT